MLFNEFLKEHKKLKAQQATTAELKKEIALLTATVKAQAEQIHKMSALIGIPKALPKVALNNERK